MIKEKIARIESLDQLKGFGIVLVVTGHFIEPYRERFSIINSIFICIYAFHMPLFCLLSGMVAKFDVRKIFFRMVWIYIWSQLLYLICCMIVDSEKFAGGVKQFIRQLVYPYWHMWYLYALIIWLLSIAFVEWTVRHIPKFVILLGYIVIMLASGYIYLPLALTRVVVFYVFFIVGYLYKDILLQLIKGQKSGICYLISFIFLTILLVPIGMNAEKINANILWEYLSYLEGGYTLLERFGFCAGAMAISLLICCINTLYKNSILVKLGKNTMSIYIFHAIFVKGFDQLEAITGMEQNIFSFAARLTTAAFVISFLQSKPILRLTGKIWNFPMNRLK